MRRVKAGRADRESFQLACSLSQLPNASTVSLIGYSFVLESWPDRCTSSPADSSVEIHFLQIDCRHIGPEPFCWPEP